MGFMMNDSISYVEFNILNSTRLKDAVALAQAGDDVLAGLQEKGLLSGDLCITEAGLRALAPYRVDNAVIMAGGLASRLAPLSYEHPKGLQVVHGEVLIERQIKQLQEAGISDITLVVGYRKEEFSYLEDLLGVKTVVNEDFARRDTSSAIRCVESILANTYICSADSYFARNPFDLYVYSSYCSAMYVRGDTPAFCLHTMGASNRVSRVTRGGRNAWTMLGNAFWSRDFSAKFREILNAEYDLPETASKSWEKIYSEHAGELPMLMRRFRHDELWVFDSLEELSKFDPEFMENVGSEVIDDICAVLMCQRSEIHGIKPLTAGLTNVSFRFTVGDTSYVYRHPGEGTEEIIERHGEAFSEAVAKKIGLDTTFVYEDINAGWKITRYIENARDLDYHNPADVEQAMALLRKLHESGYVSHWKFDLHDEITRVASLLREEDIAQFSDYAELADMAEQLYTLAQEDGVVPVLCHNDYYYPNFLVTEDSMDVIDWEYSGMSDYASDLGVFICCSDYTYEQALDVLKLYFQRDLSGEELFHCLAYVSLASFYWFNWALYKTACGNVIGEFLQIWHDYAKLYGKRALDVKAAMR